MAEEPQACPFCGSDEHLSMSQVGSLTSDMPARPFRVVCNHLDHDTVSGPVAYGRNGAIAAWNTRAAPATPAATDAARRPEQEPVAWRYRSTERDGGWNTWHFPGHPDLDGGDWDLQPLYANALPTLFQDGAAAWRLSGEHGNSYTGEVDRAKSAALLPGVTVTPLYASPQAGKVHPEPELTKMRIAEAEAYMSRVRSVDGVMPEPALLVQRLTARLQRISKCLASPAPAAPKVEEGMVDAAVKKLTDDHGIYEDDDHDDKLIVASPAEAKASIEAAYRQAVSDVNRMRDDGTIPPVPAALAVTGEGE